MSDIQTWLENLPDRGDETLVGVPPSALAELLDQVHKLRNERDKLRKEHRAMSKGAQTNAEIAKRQAEKIAELREQLRTVTAERDALRQVARIAHTLYLFTDWAEPFDGDDEDRCEPCDIQLSWGDVHRVWAARDRLEKYMEKVKQYE